MDHLLLGICTNYGYYHVSPTLFIRFCNQHGRLRGRFLRPVPSSNCPFLPLLPLVLRICCEYFSYSYLGAPFPSKSTMIPNPARKQYKHSKCSQNTVSGAALRVPVGSLKNTVIGAWWSDESCNMHTSVMGRAAPAEKRKQPQKRDINTLGAIISIFHSPDASINAPGSFILTDTISPMEFYCMFLLFEKEIYWAPRCPQSKCLKQQSPGCRVEDKGQEVFASCRMS